MQQGEMSGTTKTKDLTTNTGQLHAGTYRKGRCLPT